MCLVCDTPRLKKVENYAWEILDKYNPTILIEGSYESLVRQAAKDLSLEVTEEEVGAIAYHIASGG